MRIPNRWPARLIVAAVVSATVASTGCTPPPGPTPRVATAGGDVALVHTEDGLVGLPVGSGEPSWVHDGAVAAPDGSAVFALRPSTTPSSSGEVVQELVRVDARSGAVHAVGRIPAPDGTRVAAVEPGGRRVALTRPDGASTLLFDYRPDTATLQDVRAFEGVVEPEAYSTDGTRVFAARIYADRYHVHILELATGRQYPTFGPGKTRPPEDMYGSAVQAVLSPDGHQLATLYRDTSSPDHTAFVHLLSLADGQTICIDLHAPFGTGELAADVIEWRGSTIAVGHHATPGTPTVMATFDAEGWGASEPQDHYHAEVHENPPVPAPTLPAGVADVDGFRRFIALAS